MDFLSRAWHTTVGRVVLIGAAALIAYGILTNKDQDKGTIPVKASFGQGQEFELDMRKDVAGATLENGDRVRIGLDQGGIGDGRGCNLTVEVDSDSDDDYRNVRLSGVQGTRQGRADVNKDRVTYRVSDGKASVAVRASKSVGGVDTDFVSAATFIVNTRTREDGSQVSQLLAATQPNSDLWVDCKEAPAPRPAALGSLPAIPAAIHRTESRFPTSLS